MATLILMGGKNTRMGGFVKGLLNAGNETFLERILNNIGNFQNIYLSLNNNFTQEDIKKYESMNLKVVLDIYDNIGPIGGIYSALKKCKEDYLFVTTCDMPYINRDFIDYLKSYIDDNIDVVFCRDKSDRLYPLAAIYSKKIIPIIEDMIKYKEYKLSKLIFASKYVSILVEDMPFSKDIFTNINTIEEYRLFQKKKGAIYMKNIELELATKLILDSTKEIEEVEEVFICDARERLLGEDIYAPINQPPFDRSPLDGYALKSENTKMASKESPIKLKVVDDVFAGEQINTVLKDNEAIRIMTGAKIPKGADCVIRQENTDYGMDYVNIYEELNQYQNYCFEGEDIKKGTNLIKKGEKLNYIHIGILASMGYEKVKVKRKPRVAILSTGYEIIPLDEPLREGKIYDSNRMMIEARLLDYGCDVISAKAAKDNETEIAMEIERISNDVDLVITTGGVSVGKKDLIHKVIEKLGAKMIFWRVNMKPGTPAMYSLYKDKPILSLSGNPFAAIATFELMGKELIYKLTGDKEYKMVRKTATMEDNFEKASPSRRFIRAIYNGEKVYLTKGGHSSGILSSMIGCNCLIDIKPGTDKLAKGDKVEIILLDE